MTTHTQRLFYEYPHHQTKVCLLITRELISNQDNPRRDEKQEAKSDEPSLKSADKLGLTDAATRNKKPERL